MALSWWAKAGITEPDVEGINCRHVILITMGCNNEPSIYLRTRHRGVRLMTISSKALGSMYCSQAVHDHVDYYFDEVAVLCI
jgi:hypothetical protein